MTEITILRRLLFLSLGALLLCSQLFVSLPAVSAVPALITTIPVGINPEGICVNPETNRIYAANVNSGSVSVIDGATNTLEATIPVGALPWGACVNTVNNRVYVTNQSSANVSVINGSTNTVIATIAVGTWPRGIGVNPNTNRIYVANMGSSTVSVIDGSTNTVTATLAVGSSPWGVGVNPAANRVYVANNDSGSVSVIDGSTDTVTAAVSTGDYPSAVAVNPVNNRIYAALETVNRVAVIDGATNTVTTTVPVGGFPCGVCVNPINGRVYVTGYTGSSLTTIDGSTNTVASSIGAGHYPREVCVNPSTGRVYIANEGSSNVLVYYEPIIVAAAGAGGSISPAGNVGATYQANQPFTITPSTGFHVTDVLVDGVSRGALTSYTFNYVTADHTISASFALNNYTISTSVSGGHGSIQGAQSVDHGDSASVAITPDPGYHIATITDNGTPQAAANPYAIANVTAAHNVVVTFAADSYSVNASVFYTGHGTVDPATQSVTYGGTASIDLVPDAGYHASFILDNGASVAVADPYIIPGVGEGHEVVVFFEPDNYAINATVDGSGEVTGAGDYDYGTTATLTAAPDAGWHFVNWTDGTGEVSTDASYSFTVTGARDLTAHFALNDYAVNAAVFHTGHGTVDPATQSVAYGGSASIDLVPDAGYQPVYILDNGVSVPVADPYIIDEVGEKHNVTVFFDLETYTIGVVANGDGSVSGGGSYEYRDPVTVSAVPDPGWYFVNWTEGGTPVSTDADYTFTASSDRDLIAHFAPIPTDTWYLAEGCTEGGIETWVLVENPNPTPATLDLTFATAEGVVRPPELQGYVLAPETRASFDAGAYVKSYDLATMVKSTGGDIVVERSMYGPDRAWATESIGTRELATSWYLAEGSTGEGFETWVLVLNPGDTPATCSLDFMTSTGEVPGPQNVELPPVSRKSFRLNDYTTDYDVSTRVTASGPVVAERAMYGAERSWAHASIGTPAPAPDWFLAEGSTGEGFETWVLVQNPNASAVTCDLTLMTSSGPLNPPELQDVALADHSRRSFRLNDYVTDYDVSTVVSSSGGEVIAERSMYDTSRTWGTCSIGAVTPASAWHLAEGSTGEHFETWVLVQNPAADTVEVDLDFFTSSGEQAGPHDVLIPAFSRRSFRLNDYLTDYNVSTVVSASGGVVVERAMYGDERAWATCSIGVIGFPYIPGVTTTIAVGDEPYGIGVNTVTNRVYVTNVFDGTVSVINGATDTVIATVPVGVEPYSVGVNPNTDRVYVANLASDNVSVIDGATNTVTAVIPVGSGPEGVCVNPVTDRIYVANGGDGTVSVIDGATDTVTGTIAVGAAPWGIAVNFITNRVYVANNSDDTMSVIDGATNTVIATVDVGDDPRAVAVNPATNRVYAANFYSDDVTVIDGATNTVTATVVTGSSHMGVGVDPNTNEVYVSNMFGYNVSVIDGATNTVKGTVTVGSAPTGIGVNPVTGKVYVVNGTSDDVSVF